MSQVIPDAVVFDMDGTLFDSSAAVPDAYIAAVQELGGPVLERHEVVARYVFGPPMFVLRDVFGRDMEGHELDTFHRHLDAQAHVVSVYPGVLELLDDLQARGVRLAVFTGASDESARLLLGASGLAGRFELVLGCDEFVPKPDPEGVLAAITGLGVDAARTAYVGDSPLDQQAAYGAGAIAVAAGWGHLHDPEQAADLVAATPGDVLSLFDVVEGDA